MQWIQAWVTGKSLVLLTLLLGLSVSSAAAAILSGGVTSNTSTDLTISQLTLTIPSDAEVGDLLIASIAVKGGAPAAIVSPQGWTRIARTDNDSNVGLETFWKYHTATESGGTWTITPRSRAVGGIVRYAGTRMIDPIIATTSNSGRGTTGVALSVDAEAGDQVVALYAYDVGITSTNRFLSPDGMTEKLDRANTPFGPSLSVHDRAQATSGPTGNSISAFGNGPQRNWVAQQFVIRPALSAVENFDSYPDGALTGTSTGEGWTSAWSGSGIQVQGLVALEGNKSAMVSSVSSEPKARRTFEPRTRGTVHWVQSKDGGNHGHGIKLLSGNTSVLFAQIGSDLGTPGLEWVVTDGAGIAVLDPYVINHIDSADVEFDVETDQFRVSINGGPFSTWMNFANNVNAIDGIELITTSAGFSSVNMYWDDIRITD